MRWIVMLLLLAFAARAEDVSLNELKTKLATKPPTKVLYADFLGSGKSDKALLVAQLRSIKGPVALVYESGDGQAVADAIKASERSDVSHYQIAEAGSQQQPGNLPTTPRLVYTPRTNPAHSPYEVSAEHQYNNKRTGYQRTDAAGRDQIANFLFETARDVAPVEIYDRGGKLVPITAEILTRAKYEGFKPASPGLSITVADLMMDGQPGHNGFNALAFMKQWPQLVASLRETKEGAAALEYIQTRFRSYQAEITKEGKKAVSKGDAWRAGLYKVRAVNIDGKAIADPKFGELVDEMFRAEADSRLSTSARFQERMGRLVEETILDGEKPNTKEELAAAAAKMEADPGRKAHYEGQLEVLKSLKPTVEDMQAVQQQEIQRHFLAAEAVELAALENGLVTGPRAAEHKTKLSTKFADLIAHNDYNAPVVSDVRRHTYQRGIDFGGRWLPKIHQCREFQYLTQFGAKARP